MILGGNKDEGCFFLPQFLLEKEVMDEVNDDFDTHGPPLILGVDPDDITDEDSATANIIKNEYLDGLHSNFTKDNMKRIGRMYTDVLFLAHIDVEAKLFAENMDEPVYYYNYRFGYQPGGVS